MRARHNCKRVTKNGLFKSTLNEIRNGPQKYKHASSPVCLCGKGEPLSLLLCFAVLKAFERAPALETRHF